MRDHRGPGGSARLGTRDLDATSATLTSSACLVHWYEIGLAATFSAPRRERRRSCRPQFGCCETDCAKNSRR